MIGVVSVRNPKQKRIIGFQNIIGLLYSVSIAAAAAYIPLSAAAAAAAYIPLSAAAAAYIPLSCVWLARNRSRWHRSSVGTTFPLQLWRYHESEFVWRPRQLRQWYGEIQSQLPLSEMWPVVETCGTLHRHERTCTGSVIYKYPGGVYHTAKTVFDRLEDEGIEVPAEFYGILIAACIMKSVSCIVYKIKKVL